MHFGIRQTIYGRRLALTQEGICPLEFQGGDAMEYYYLIVLVLIVATGYIISIKK